MTAPSPRRQTSTSNASERTFASRSEPRVRVIDACRVRAPAMAVVRQRVSPRTMHGQPTGAISVCPASSDADSSWLSSRMRSMTWATGASGATRWATCCSVSPDCTWTTASVSGTGVDELAGADDPAELGHHTEPHRDQRGEQGQSDGGGGRDRAPAVRCARHHHAGAAVAQGRAARPAARRALGCAIRPPCLQARGNGRRATGPARTSRVSRTVICLAFRFARSLLCSNFSRSGVRLIEHVIELLPNDRTGHRQISATAA